MVERPVGGRVAVLAQKVLARTGVLAQLRRLWTADVEAVSTGLRHDVDRLNRRIEELEGLLRDTTARAHRADRASMQVRLAGVLNRQEHDRIERLPALLDERRIAEHVQRAVAAAPLITDPYEHIVVQGVLPDDIYELLVSAIPPVAYFEDRDPIKQDLRLPMDFGPALSTAVWGFMDDVIARRIIRPAVIQKFHEPLQRHFDTLFGPTFRDRANQMAQAASGGRLMLRRPGYHLAPHRDPKHSMLTCLMYLAREGDSEAYGTQIFRVVNDDDASYKQTYYPEEEGRACELVKVVPFRPNTMLVNLNSRGAHGAIIPPDAPADLERYTYQFYVSPQKEALSALIKSLPSDRRALWQKKSDVRRDTPEPAAAAAVHG